MTPEQLSDDMLLIGNAATASQHRALIDDEVVRESIARNIINPLRKAHAAALEELARVKVERDNERKITSHTYDLVLARAERTESALAESERKCERLKFHAEAMCPFVDRSYTNGNRAVQNYCAEFKEES